MADFTLIVPVYNEAQGLSVVLAEVVRSFPDAEIIVVNDGSTDDTLRVAQQFPVTVISHPANRGYGAALKTGITHAKREFLVFFDGDGQHDPLKIRPMLERLEGADLVIGERTVFTRTSPLHFAGRRVLSRLIRFLTRMRLRDINCGLRAVRRSVIQRYLSLLPDGFSFSTTSTVVFAKFGRRLVFLPVEVRPRVGQSSVRLLRDGYNTLLLIIRLIALFDPLRVFLPPAFVLVALGATYGLYTSWRVHAGLSVGALSLLLTGFMVFLLGVICGSDRRPPARSLPGRRLMCGIAGMASFGRPVSESLVRRMTASLVHRGPDEDGYHVADRVALGVRRLRIIDLLGSRQPVHSEDRSIWAVFNGELYDFKRVRLDLEARGHRFYTEGDSEVIVHAYEEWGEQCVDHLTGMFAIAVWDEPRQRLILFRDRIGIKPLYYAFVAGTLLFGSEMKALLRARAEYPLGDIEPRALRAFLSFGYVPAPLTMFQNARCLPPGHRLVYRAGAPPDVAAYWDVPLVSREALIDDETRATTEFREILKEAVVHQMVSDVPIGAFLSGGLDSTAVVWRMAEASRDPIRTFSVGFAEKSYDETPWARRVATRVGSIHEEELISPKQVARELTEIIGLFDEPFADSSAIPLHFLARMTRAHGVTVVLTGDGGDELFGGYETYLADRLLVSFQRLPSGLRALARRAGGRIPVSHRKISLEQKLKRFLEFSESAPLVAHALWRSVFQVGELSQLLVDGLGAGLTERNAAELLVGDLDTLPDPGDGLNRFCYLDTKFYLPADMLVKVDRVTMAHSLEARVPLLDERLVAFAFRLSPRLKWRGRTGKVLMRRALRGVVDDAVLARPKAGFNVPMPIWIGGLLRELFRDVLSPAMVARVGLFRPAYVERLFAEHESRRADHSFRLYALLAFHLWFERYVREFLS